MCAEANAVPSGPTDYPKAVKLVRKIAEKTRAGKIHWTHSRLGLTATIPRHLHAFMSLIQRNPFALGSRKDWLRFIIRGEGDREILRVQNRSHILDILLQGGEAPLLEEVSDLYRVIITEGENEIDRAIEEIEKM